MAGRILSFVNAEADPFDQEKTGVFLLCILVGVFGRISSIGIKCSSPIDKAEGEAPLLPGTNSSG